MAEHPIGTVDDFPPGEGIHVRIDDHDVAVFNLDGQFRAIYDVCPHKGAFLHEAGTERYNPDRCGAPYRGAIDPDRETVRCPWHEMEFSLDTGRNPATGLQLPTFDVVVEGEQVVLKT